MALAWTTSLVASVQYLTRLVVVIWIGLQVGEARAHTGNPKVTGLRTVGRATVTHLCSQKYNNDDKPVCRTKRDTTTRPTSNGLEIHIETNKAIFDHQKGHKLGVVKPIHLTVGRSDPLIAPNYKLIVRKGNSIASINSTVPYPTCLYNGTFDNGQGHVALANCDSTGLNGVILADNRRFVIERLKKNHPEFVRAKREAFHDDDENLVLIYETKASGGECGIKSYNVKRMRAPALPTVVSLKQDEGGRFHSRKKRSTRAEKSIELAVFVDDVLYSKSSDESNAIDSIQNYVFTYLNSVQIYYESERLDTKIRIVLVRLEIHTSEVRSLDKKGGNIEGYLESFCKWQREENPESWDKRSTHPDHWDHGLMLTGLDLYDGAEEYTNVIGLAWVSGMCHPSYSCTINEGNTFESVYVIAHEMGHNLGMNHDGEIDEGNNCDPDLYLMSPVLGPGKVTWSTCSNREVKDFLAGRPSNSQQPVCLDDLPPTLARYDYLKENLRPGEKFNAFQQCQQSYGTSFIPHVKKESPFEDLCRELWCSNGTHALRAHPALEGTDCSAKPYPYGSFCIEGQCVPFYPDDVVRIDEPSNDDGNSVDNTPNNDNPKTDTDVTRTGSNGGPEDDNFIQGRPVWYDPIFTQIFVSLKTKYGKQYINYDL